MDKLLEKINFLICKYDNDKRNIDENFFYELLFLVTSYYGISYYINDITFNEFDSYAFYKNNIINLSINRILDKWHAFCYYRKIPTVELHKSMLFYISRIFLHELEHVNQEKIMMEDSESLIGRILVESNCLNNIFSVTNNGNSSNNSDDYKNKCEMIKKIYEENYLLAPQERLSEIRATLMCYKSSQIDNLFISDYFLAEMYKSYLMGYNIEKEPTKIYLSKVNPTFDFRQIEAMSCDLSNEKRCLYGLKTTDETIHELILKRKMLLLKFM